METIGEYLRTKREEKGLTLRDMADRTRISLTFLQALEEGNYSVIPGEVFVSGFIRSYAKELGLKEKEVMARYRETMAGQQPEALPMQVPDVRPAPEAGRRKISAWIIYAAVAVVAVAVISYLITTAEYDGAEPARETTTAAVSPREPLPAEPQPPMVAMTTMMPMTSVAAAASPPVQQEKKTPVADRVSVSIRAKSLTWYYSRTDGARRESGLIKPGEEVRLDAEREIILDLGNAGGVEIEYWDRVFGPFGKQGEVKRGILFTKGNPDYVIRPQRPAAPVQP